MNEGRDQGGAGKLWVRPGAPGRGARDGAPVPEKRGRSALGRERGGILFGRHRGQSILPMLNQGELDPQTEPAVSGVWPFLRAGARVLGPSCALTSRNCTQGKCMMEERADLTSVRGGLSSMASLAFP